MSYVLARAGYLITVKGEAERGLRMLHAAAGLTDEAYRDRDAARAALARHLGRLSPATGGTYAMVLAGALGMFRRQRDGLLVLETYLGIDQADYRDTGRLRHRLAATLPALPGDLHVGLLSALIGILGIQGRGSEATALLAADLALPPPSGPADHDTRAAALASGLAVRRLALGPEAFAMYWSLVAGELDELGVGVAGVPVLEAALDLTAGDYAAPERLGTILGPWRERFAAPVTWVMSVAMLAAMLDTAGRPADGLAVIEWAVGVGAADYDDVVELGRTWRRFRDGQAADVSPTLWRVWGGLLTDLGRHGDALALLAADNGLLPDDFRDPARFGPKLTRRLAATQVDTRAAYVFSLVTDLRAIDPAGSAAVADWFLRGYPALVQVPEGGDPAVHHVVPLLVQWFDAAGPEQPEQPDEAWAMCGRAVGYLRRSLPMTAMKIEDRRAFIDYVGRLRRQVLQVGDAADRPDRVLQAQLWDAELDQRLLFERFLLQPVEAIAPGPAPVDGWPLAEPEPATVDSHLPDPAACPDDDLLRLLVGDGPTVAGPPAAGEPSDVAPDGWLSEAEELIRDGVTPELLAAMLGADGLLVRAGFRADDALVWAALRADAPPGAAMSGPGAAGPGSSVASPGLTVAASGSGLSGDRRRLHWAALRHDLGLLLVPLRRRRPTAHATLVADLTTCIRALRDSAGEPEAMAAAVRAYAAAPSSLGAGEGLAERLWAVLDAGAETQEELARLQATATAGNTAGSGIEEIDGVTRAYLAEVAAIWPLDGLAAVLRPGDDVVFQLEDVLQAVPVAHCPLPGGGPLYTRVRSTRVSLSLLMTVLQHRVEAEAGDGAPGMLAVSHFADPDEDPSAEYAKWLHHGQRLLARRAGTVCRNAGEAPPGSAGGLRAALLAEPGFRTVTVCGHGSISTGGIQLAEPQPWRGDGCDWRGVGLLLLVSCSVGRLQQTGDQDVEGLCVRLALHRARAVLACRWPVVTPHAIAFANEVVAQYLRPEPGTLARARALNAARHHFLTGDNHRRPGELAGLNTVAAFELYGLG